MKNQRDPYFLLSRRAGFRIWTSDDMPFAIELWGNPEVMKYLDARERLDERDIQERLEKQIAFQESHGVQYWPVFTLDSGDFIGCCGLKPCSQPCVSYELGAHLRKEFWGKGYAMELSRTAIVYAFGTLNQDALFAGHHPKNEASRQIFQKLGFVYSHDEYYPPCGLSGPCYFLTSKEYFKRWGH